MCDWKIITTFLDVANTAVRLKNEELLREVVKNLIVTLKIKELWRD